MSSIWSNKLKTTTGKQDFIQELTDVLDKMEADLDFTELGVQMYDLPNWDYRQAHYNGKRKVIRELRKLINLDQKGTINERKSIEQPT